MTNTFRGRKSKTCLVLCPRLTLFSCWRVKHVHTCTSINFPTQITPLPASETAASLTLKRLASSAPGRLPKKKIGGRLLCVVGAIFALCYRSNVLLQISPVFAKHNAPGCLDRGVYSHYYGITSIYCTNRSVIITYTAGLVRPLRGFSLPCLILISCVIIIPTLYEGYIVSVHRMVTENRPVDPGSIQGSHRPISFIRIKHRTRANDFL